MVGILSVLWILGWVLVCSIGGGFELGIANFPVEALV